MNLHKELFNINGEGGVTRDTITTPEALWEPCGDADSDTSKEVAALTPDDDTSSVVVPRDTTMKSMYFSNDDLTSTIATRKRSLDIAIQTDLTGNEVESKRNYCIRVISPPPCAATSLPTKTTTSTNETDKKNDASTMSSIETSMKQLSDGVSARLVNDIRPTTNLTANNKTKLHTTSVESDRNKDSSSDGPCNKCSLDADTSKTGGAKSKRRRRKKLSVLTKPLNQTTDSAVVSETKPSGAAPMDIDDEGVFQLELTEDDVAVDRVDDCVRSHSAAASTTTLTDIQCQEIAQTIEEKLRLTDEWADNQFAAGLHPFSDGDITPVMR